MYPILLELGPVIVFSLWIFVAFGFLFGLLIINKLAQKSRLKLAFLANHSLVIFFAGLVVSRLVYVLRNWNYFFGDLNLNSFFEVFYIWDKGLSAWGAVLGILLSVAYFAWRENENPLRWLDILAVSILGAMVFAHVGAFLDGRHFGNETSLPWGVVFENSLYAVPIHPTQIYAAVYTALLAFIMFSLFSRKIGKEAGNISIFTLCAYSFLRFLEEFLRGDESNIFFGVREGFIYTLLGMIAGGILLYVRFKKTKPTHNEP